MDVIETAYKFVECSEHCDGCVGPGPTNCIECAPHHQKEGDECVGTLELSNPNIIRLSIFRMNKKHK